MTLNYVIWNPNEVLLQLGALKIRWYSLMIICAFLSARSLISYFFQKEGRPVEDVEKFSLFILVSCLVGARLGEVFFYSPMYYLKHPLEAILPIKLNPHFEIVGYKGLSYHGALIGAMLGTLLYANYKIHFSVFPWRFKIFKQKKKGQSVLWLLTPLAFGVLMGFFVRIGNFINSEIIGTPTHSQYGVLFAKHITDELVDSYPAIKSVKILKNSTNDSEKAHGYVPILLECTFSSIALEEDNLKKFIENKLKNYLTFNSQVREDLYIDSHLPLAYTITKNKKSQYVATIQAFGIPRHPVQLYESFSYLITLIFLFLWWKRKRATLRDGLIAAVAMMVSYSFRFFFEFFKDPFNVLIPGKHPITMGHMLSLLTVLGGIVLLILVYRKSNTKNLIQTDK
jgi:prolipoprotein diacylglyceryl transferase